MDHKYTVLVLAILVAAAEANSGSLKSLLLPKALEERNVEKWERNGLTANLNEYIDNTIEMLVPFIKNHGLDPMSLPDVESGFAVRPVLITYSAWIRITRGTMTGLVNIGRNGDQRVEYNSKKLRVRLSLQFRDLEFNYRYSVKVMHLGPRGGIRGSLNRFVVNVDVLLDFNRDEIQLQEFSLTDIGRLRVRLTGNILVDWLVNPVISVFVLIFDDVIIKVVESNINSAVHDAINAINSNVRELVQRLESY